MFLNLFVIFKVLNKSRKRQSDVIQERSRVMDLICHALPSVSASAGSLPSRHAPGSFSYSASINGRSSGLGGMDAGPEIDPLGAYTPEVDAALKEAKDARDRFDPFFFWYNNL